MTARLSAAHQQALTPTSPQSHASPSFTPEAACLPLHPYHHRYSHHRRLRSRQVPTSLAHYILSSLMASTDSTWKDSSRRVDTDAWRSLPSRASLLPVRKWRLKFIARTS